MLFKSEDLTKGPPELSIVVVAAWTTLRHDGTVDRLPLHLKNPGVCAAVGHAAGVEGLWLNARPNHRSLRLSNFLPGARAEIVVRTF